ncbi:MAG: proprotein convertase P-domain-containing protein [Oligoflexales bacterium]
MKLVLGLCLIFLTNGAYGSILPPNNLDAEDQLYWQDSNIDEQQFNSIIDGVIRQYVDIVKTHSARLVVYKYWSSSTVNASAGQNKADWYVNMYGGLARRPEITPDAFTLVVCHELGHHLGGFPFNGPLWAANEGQSDYFATQACARKIWKSQLDANAKYRDLVDPIVKENCDSVWKNGAEQDLCYRIATAGKALATLLAAVNKEPPPQLDTPDKTEVAETRYNHPRAQCRLDTYVQGALCTVNFIDTTIPGRRHRDGQDSLEAEFEGSKVSCTSASLFEMGIRPRCWFKPEQQILVGAVPGVWAPVIGDEDRFFEPGETWSLFPKIRNEGQRTFSNIVVKAETTDPSLTITGEQAVVKKLEPGEEKTTENPFSVYIDEQAACGDKLVYKVSANLDERKKEFTDSIILGQSSDSEIFSQNTPIRISDYQTETSEILIPGPLPLKRIEVSLRMDTLYSKNFTVTLASPEGELFTIHDRTPTEEGGLRGSFIFPTNASVTNGVWKLTVRNWSIFPGTLKNWSVQLIDFHCD